MLHVTPILKSLWIHRQTLERLERLDMDMESQTPRQELYDEKYEPQEGEMTEEEQEEYKEQWADELQELATGGIAETAPARVSLKEFPRLKNLSIGSHTICYLARGVGDGKTQIDSKSFNLVDHIPSTLDSLRIYGLGETVDRWTPYLDYESDIDVDAQIEQLAHEKDAKLPGPKVEGIDLCIPNGRTVDERENEDDLELFWKDPDDNRFRDDI